jgi:hypothetical protein
MAGGLVQDANYVAYYLGADVTNYSPYGRACMYGQNTKEVVIATEDTPYFAGIIYTIQISKSSQSPYNTTAYAGDNCTLVKIGMIDAVASGTIEYGQYVAVGPNGTLKALPNFATTPSLEQLVTVVGVAESSCNDGEEFIVRLVN